MLTYNRQTINILKKYSTSFDRILSNDEKQYLSSQGINTNVLKCDHNETCQLAISAYQKCTKSQVLNAFFYGLANNNPIYTCVWSAYSIMTHFTPHSHTGENLDCVICSVFDGDIEHDFIVCEAIRLLGYTRRNIFQIYYNLEFMPKDVDNKYVLIGEKRLIEIFDLIKNLKNDITPRLLTTELKNNLSFKIQKPQIEALINTLGLCGILQAKDKPSYLQEFFPRIIEVKKTHSSDWTYPVDFWISQDGLDITAMEYWFDCDKKFI